MAKAPKCDFWDCFLELTVSRSEWFALRKYAYELDLNKGAYCDARLGAVNFWCGPDNKPPGWPGRITKGQLKFPREFVGSFSAWGSRGGRVKLHFAVHAHARCEKLTSGTRAYAKAIKGTQGDREWLLKQFALLRQHVALMQQNAPSPR